MPGLALPTQFPTKHHNIPGPAYSLSHIDCYWLLGLFLTRVSKVRVWVPFN
jgi:hypothetical protein